jgi:hypothetical protein
MRNSPHRQRRRRAAEITNVTTRNRPGPDHKPAKTGSAVIKVPRIFMTKTVENTRGTFMTARCGRSVAGVFVADRPRPSIADKWGTDAQDKLVTDATGPREGRRIGVP